MQKQMKQLSRREFIKAGTCGAMTVGPLINTIAQLALINSAYASTSSAQKAIGKDYKALVCLFLRGGCDMNNVLIPVGSNPQASGYANDRGPIAIPNGIVHPTYNPSGKDETLAINVSGQGPMGLHPQLKNLSNMFNNGELAFINNVGTLAEPTTTNTYSTSSLPKQLFSHSDQQTQWMSSISDQPFTSGWGARVADLYHDTWNVNGHTSMLITAGGRNKFFSGGSVDEFAVVSTGAISLAGFGNRYRGALDGNGNYTTKPSGQRLQALEKIMQYSHHHIIEKGYTDVVKNAREDEAVINQAIQAESDLNLDFDAIWKNHRADSGLAEELKAVARMIAGRELLGNNRQIFFVDVGGFDNHAGINNSLPLLLDTLDRAVGAFSDGLKELAKKDTNFDYNQVTTFQASDFNRTWTPNGTDIEYAGTDHAWGTHCLVFGGAVKGGSFYGYFPELIVGGSNAVPNKDNRGRWIPTTSVDQFAAKLAGWFGVSPGSSEMNTIFPNLYRFADPFSKEAKLNFI